MPQRVRIALLAAALAACCALPLRADDNEDAALDALEAYSSQDYAHATELYEKLNQAAPKDPLTLFMLAKCRNRTGRADDALALIDRATQAGATFEAIPFERGRAFFLQGKYPEALAQYEAFHKTVKGDAYSLQAHTEALIAAERYQEALDLLAQVTVTPPVRLHQELLTSAAMSGLGKTQEAIARLDQDLQQSWSESERKALGDAVSYLRHPSVTAGRPSKPWWANLTTGLVYDTNVPTLGKKPKPREPGFEHTGAFRGEYSIDGGYRWQATDRFSLTGRLFLLAHTNDDLSRRDIAIGRVTVTPEYRVLDDVTVGVEGFYSHLFLNQKTLTNSLGTGAFVQWRETKWTSSRLNYGYRWETFYDKTVAAKEDLDGTADTITFAQDFLVPGTTLAFRLAYAHENSHTNGSDFDYDSDTELASMSYRFPLEIDFAATYQHITTTYHHPNSRLNFVENRGNVTRVLNFTLSRDILPNLNLSASLNLTDAESNVPDFDFDRDIWGVAATYRF